MTTPLPPTNHPDAEYYFDHRGWNVFRLQDDYGQGKVKDIYFAISRETSEEKEIDITPYGYGDLRLIRRIIEMDFPERIGLNPLTHEDLNVIQNYGKAAE